MTESMGTEIKAIVIEYDGTQIPFQYQMWRIRESSVCNNLKHSVAEFSQCSIKASRLFNELCSGLATNQNDDPIYRKTKNMYCNAAISYEPTVANISSETPESELLKAKRECNAATIEAMDTNDPSAIGHRDRTCQKYNELKE